MTLRKEYLLCGLMTVCLGTVSGVCASDGLSAIESDVAKTEVNQKGATANEGGAKLTGGAMFDDRITKFFEQIKRLRALKKFSYTMISEVIDMPLELQSDTLYSATGDLQTDVWETAEVSHGKDEKDITLVTLYPAKDLIITCADIEKALGVGMSSPEMKTMADLKEKFGYEQAKRVLFQKGKLNINFEVITRPQERVYKVAFYRL
jgi:hypothetical protein